MATTAQLNANIVNARQSTGPRTPEGRQASSRNSLRHGLYASLSALPAEDKRQVNEILAHFTEQFPQPEAEQHLHELALAWFRRDRARAMEAAFLDIQLMLAREKMADAQVSREHLLASILMHDSVGNRNLDRLHRWDRAYSRDIDRALKALHSLPEPEPADQEIETAKTKPIDIPYPNTPMSTYSPNTAESQSLAGASPLLGVKAGNSSST